jgi:hypothetical protein
MLSKNYSILIYVLEQLSARRKILEMTTNANLRRTEYETANSFLLDSVFLVKPSFNHQKCWYLYYASYDNHIIKLTIQFVVLSGEKGTKLTYMTDYFRKNLKIVK